MKRDTAAKKPGATVKIGGRVDASAPARVTVGGKEVR